MSSSKAQELDRPHVAQSCPCSGHVTYGWSFRTHVLMSFWFIFTLMNVANSSFPLFLIHSIDMKKSCDTLQVMDA